MSESKARLERTISSMSHELGRQEQTIVFLVQALVDIQRDHPEVKVDMTPLQLPERVWRQVFA